MLIIRYLVFHALAGAVIGYAVARAIELLDIGGIGSLLASTDVPVAASLLFYGSFAITFSSLLSATVIFTSSALEKHDSEDHQKN